MRKILSVPRLLTLLTLLCVFFVNGQTFTHSSTAQAAPLIQHAQAAPLIWNPQGPDQCGDGSKHPDYLGIYAPQGWSCFAGDGYEGFRIDGSAFIHAGNNNGWVRCYGGNCGNGTTWGFVAFEEVQLNDTVITQVDITSQW